MFFFFQEIEQDRHLLRRKLLSTQSECDTRVLELQADIRELQNALDDRDNALKQTEKEKTLLIAELTEQNQRLQMQIKEVSTDQKVLNFWNWCNFDVSGFYNPAIDQLEIK